MLIQGTKRQDGFKIFCVALGVERLSLHLPQAVRNIMCFGGGVWGCAEFVIAEWSKVKMKML